MKRPQKSQRGRQGRGRGLPPLVRMPQVSTNVTFRATKRYCCRPPDDGIPLDALQSTFFAANSLNFSQAVVIQAPTGLAGEVAACFSSYTIRRIQLWYTPPMNQPGDPVSLTPLGGWTISLIPCRTVSGQQIDMKEYANTSPSNAVMAYVDYRPSRDEGVGYTQSVLDSSALFQVLCFPGTYMDVTADFTFADGAVASQTSVVAVPPGVTLGEVGSVYFDANRSYGTRQWVPVGIEAIFG